MAPSKRSRCARRSLDQLISSYAPAPHVARQAYWQVVTAIRSSSTLLTRVAGGLPNGPTRLRRLLRGCVRMARHCDEWQHAPVSWKASSASAFLQYCSFVGHLFDVYPVPKFMPPSWCGDYTSDWEIELYLHLAKGRGIRQFSWPSEFGQQPTKQVARWFMQAPDHSTPASARRWALVRSLGGNARLAAALMTRSELDSACGITGFWESAVRFFIDNSAVSVVEIHAIVQFAHQQRFVPAETTWGPGAGSEPLQPNLTLKGRSLMSLRRHMTHWRAQLLKHRDLPITPPERWSPSPIAPLRVTDGDVHWTIDELLSAQELRAEGGIMKHCVATYIHDCARRQTTIWSLKCERNGRRMRSLTIEVWPRSRTIGEALGKRNTLPDGMAKQMLHRWAIQEGLRFANEG